MKNLIIVGAGGMGREVFSWLSQEIRNKKDYKIKGFIDDDPSALNNYNYPVSIIGNIKDYQPNSGEILAVSILEPKTRKKIVEALLKRSSLFYTLIHPSVTIGTNVKIGEGSIICPNCILSNDIVIHEFVFINTSSTIGHDTTIGSFTSINGKVEITGNVQVGEGCLFGVGAKVIPGRRIGNGAKIGAGSVIIRNVPSDSTVFGNPAKKILSPIMCKTVPKMMTKSVPPGG